MGISQGWGDTYGSSLAYQWIDVTGVPNGTYWLIATADKENAYLETNEKNNCAWARIRLSRRATVVTVLTRGVGCAPPGVAVPAPSASPSVSPSPATSASPGASGLGQPPSP
jgi:hypothetical protein